MKQLNNLQSNQLTVGETLKVFEPDFSKEKITETVSEGRITRKKRSLSLNAAQSKPGSTKSVSTPKTNIPSLHPPSQSGSLFLLFFFFFTI